MKEDYQEKDLYKVADENYHHIVRVMRMTPNDRCYLVFQNKTAILAEIVEIDSTSVYFKEISKEEMDKELPIEVTIACGLPKGDKLEWIVQKGTELGGNQFIGFPAKTSVVKWDHKKRETVSYESNCAMISCVFSTKETLGVCCRCDCSAASVAIFCNLFS
jgi:16S rRNA (uracil1498-N3)-methyltransferase